MDSSKITEARQATVAYLIARGSAPDQAEDIAQDAIAKAVGSHDPSRGALLSTYTIQIAKHRMIDRARYNRVRSSNVEAVADTYETVDRTTPEGVLCSNAGVLRLAEIVDSLPEKERLALTCATIEGWTHAEIADLLDCAVGTVAYLVNQARAKIRKKYQG